MKTIQLTGQKPELSKLKQPAGTANRRNRHTWCVINQANLIWKFKSYRYPSSVTGFHI